MQLLSNQTAAGSSVPFSFDARGSGGTLNLYIAGVPDTASVSLEAELPDGSGYVPVDGAVFTTEGLFVVNASSFVGRVTLDAPGLATNISVWAGATGVYSVTAK